MPSIVFLLPNPSDRPVGGYKVVYEYANRLCADGYQVKLVYGVAVRPITNPLIRLAYKSVRLFRFLKFRFFTPWKPNWFALDTRIAQYLRYAFSKRRTPKGDFYVATAWSTAPWLARYAGARDDQKFYLIQSFEDWSTSKQEVEATWQLPLRKIVISPWLLDMAKQLRVDAVLIENGWDQNYFKLSNPIETRDPFWLSMLYHPAPLKGCADGLKTIDLLKQRYPNLRATLFGTVSRPTGLASWIEYYQKPDQQTHNAIYNQSAIFIAPSHLEGFALTPSEAMLCGSVVCATNIGGHQVVCHDKQTALLSPVGAPEVMADNVALLIENTELRIKLTQQALQLVRQYTWERAYKKFKGILTQSANQIQQE